MKFIWDALADTVHSTLLSYFGYMLRDKLPAASILNYWDYLAVTF